MREWLARIIADIKRANRWLDPAWKPQPSLQTAITWCDIPANTMTAAATYVWTADGWKAWTYIR